MIVVALGDNLPGRFESPRDALSASLDAMQARDIRIIAKSSLWLTEPVPVSDQPWYHNAVVAVDTGLSPFALLGALQTIENDFGRVRTLRNAPRVLDLDLIAYDDVVIDRPELILPHPRMHQRAFVLRPMAEIVPGGWRHPVTGATLDELTAALDGQDARRLDDAF